METLQIEIKLEIHVFGNERLNDDCYENGKSIHGTKIISLLKEKRDSVFTFKYSESSTLGDILAATKKELGVDTTEFELYPLSYSFLANGDRYYIEDEESMFQRVLQRYLKPNDKNEITVGVYLSNDAGAVGFAAPLRFYVNSHENGRHFKPHIHVCDVGYEYQASISIEDGEVIAGKLPRKLEKIAKKEILSKQEFYIDCWNTLTDGLRIDIDHHLGIIQY